MFGVIVFGLRSGRLLAFVARALTIVVLSDLAPSSLSAAAVHKSILAAINHAADVADERTSEASAARRRTITDWRDLISRSLSFHSNGKYNDAIQLAVEAERVANLASDGPIGECVTASAFLQGILHCEMGAYSLAESQLKRAIQGGEQYATFREQDRATLLHMLAKVEYQNARLNSAVAHIDHAIELRRKALGGSDPATLLSLIERAQILIALGQLKHARSECDSIKQSVEDVRERNSIVFNRYLAVRGVLDAESGAYAEAIELLERSF